MRICRRSQESIITTTPHQTARAEVVAVFTGRIQRITEILASATQPADAHVVRVGQHLYVHTDGRLDKNLTGIESAAVFADYFHAQAFAIHARNANGDRGQSIPLAQALQDELEHLTAMRAMFAGSASQALTEVAL